MNKAILHKEVQDFIRQHVHDDLTTLALKGSPFAQVTTKELLEQIEALAKTENKLPSWFHTQGIYYPPTLSVEQTSSEITARYKASLFEGRMMVDITGGLGVDDYFFSKRFKQVVHCEINETLSEIAAYNFEKLEAHNIKCFAGDGLSFLEETDQTDLIYADPARRDNTKKKVFLLSDCSPNIPMHLDLLFSKTDRIVLKTSPLLDLKAGMEELTRVSEVHIVAVRNDVKELLWILDNTALPDTVKVTAVNLGKTGLENQPYSFPFHLEKSTSASISSVSDYLYEPNAAIMKSGAFNLVSKNFNLGKLHPHTHLYTSHEPVEFPGRRFKVLQVEPYNKKTVKTLLGGTKANLTTRNFPESVASLRKKFRIKEGGDRYVFFCTGPDGKKLVVICEKF